MSRMELKGEALRVYDILRDHENARNNDWSLMAHYFNRHHKSLVHQNEGVPAMELRKMKHLTSAETIIRARRIVQNDLGEFPPTDPKVREARNIKEQNYTNAEVREAKDTSNFQYRD